MEERITDSVKGAWMRSLQSLNLNTVARSIIAVFCLTAAVAKIPFCIEHTISLLTPEHLLSDDLIDHMRPCVHLAYYAFQTLASVYFAGGMIWASEDRKRLSIGIGLLSFSYAMQMGLHYMMVVTSSDPQPYQWVRFIGSVSAVALTLTYMIVILINRPKVIRCGLTELGLSITGIAVFAFVLAPSGKYEFFYYFHFVENLFAWQFNAITDIMQITCIGYMVPVLLAYKGIQDTKGKYHRVS